jgi:hypothetical protein
MQAIEPENNRSLPGMLVWIRILTSAAALYLTGLFIYQYRADASESRIAEHAPTQAVVHRMNLDSTCMHRSDDGQLNLTKTYLCYLQQNTLKNNRFKSYFQPSKQQEL